MIQNAQLAQVQLFALDVKVTIKHKETPRKHVLASLLHKIMGENALVINKFLLNFNNKIILK